MEWMPPPDGIAMCQSDVCQSASKIHPLEVRTNFWTPIDSQVLRAGEHLGGVLPTSNLFAPHREQDAGEAFGNVRGGPSVENSSSKCLIWQRHVTAEEPAILYQVSQRLPAKYPQSVTKAIAMIYQHATKRGLSSGQCQA
jgi:hypothetical protein